MMSEGGEARVVRPDRAQLRWDLIDVESLLTQDHRARVVWRFVESLDLEPLYAAVKAREGTAGRPGTDPMLLLALWLYATLEGIGSARLLARLCERDVAYRWLCGGVGVNYHGLSDFRVAHEAVLDRLLSESVAALAAERVISLEEVAVDGTKVAAAAGRGSMRGAGGLERYEARARARIARLKAELDSDPDAGGRRRRAAIARAEREVGDRAAKARAALERLQAEKAARAKENAKDEAAKSERKASTTDAEARPMRFADGAVRPGYNLQFACVPEADVIVEVMATDRRNDAGLAGPMVEAMARRFGMAPHRVLFDTHYATQHDIVALAARPDGAVTVYAPPPPPDKKNATPDSQRKRAWRRRCEPLAVKQWRLRMASEDGRATLRRRRHIETVSGIVKNRGLGRLLVRGLAKVRCVALLHALAHNLWRAHVLRAASA